MSIGDKIATAIFWLIVGGLAAALIVGVGGGMVAALVTGDLSGLVPAQVVAVLFGAVCLGLAMRQCYRWLRAWKDPT